MAGGKVIGILIVVGAVLWAGAAMVARWQPSAPSGAGSTVVMRTDLSGVPAPDPSGSADPGTTFQIPAGAGCTTVDRPEGSLYLCWTAYRVLADADRVADYYRLRVLGTVSAGSGSGVRWVAVSAQLNGRPLNDVFDGWPVGTFTGPCEKVAVDLPIQVDQMDKLCGETTGTTDRIAWKHSAVWTCVGCVIPDRDAVGIVLHAAVAVPEGTLPAWSIGADLGS